MRTILLALVMAGSAVMCGGCSESGGGGQEAFYHNNREHAKWVNNPSHTPEYQNPNTGGPMFY